MSYVINSTGRSRRRRRCCGGSSFPAGQNGPAYAAYSSLLPRLYPVEEPCLCPDGCPPPYYRNVVYSGPCPPSPDDPCQPPLPPPPEDPPCYQPFTDALAYAYFAQTGSLSAARAGDGVSIATVEKISGNSFSNNQGVIRILRPGVYQATLVLSLPASATVNTQLQMTLDGAPLPGSAVTLDKNSCSASSAYVQTLFQVYQPGALFQVVSSQPFSFGGQEGETLASLILSQISPIV